MIIRQVRDSNTEKLINQCAYLSKYVEVYFFSRYIVRYLDVSNYRDDYGRIL